MRHDPGLAASPPVRYILRWKGLAVSFALPYPSLQSYLLAKPAIIPGWYRPLDVEYRPADLITQPLIVEHEFTDRIR